MAEDAPPAQCWVCENWGQGTVEVAARIMVWNYENSLEGPLAYVHKDTAIVKVCDNCAQKARLRAITPLRRQVAT